MQKHKKTALLLLVVFLLTNILPTGAVWAADPVAPTLPAVPTITITTWAPNPNTPLTAEAGSQQPIKIQVGEFELATGSKPLDLTLEFPPGMKATQTKFAGIASNTPYTVYVTMPTKAAQYDNQVIKWTLSSGQSGSVPCNVTVTPAPLNWNNADSLSKSILNVTKENFTDDGSTAPQKLKGNVNLKMLDQYGNETSKLQQNHSLYIWVMNVGNTTLGKIASDDPNSSTTGAANGCRITEIGSSRFYEITEVTSSSLLSFSFEVDEPGDDYVVYVADGDKGLTNTSTIKALSTIKKAPINLKLTQVEIVDFGGVTTRPDKNAQIKVTLINPPAEKDVYLRLPSGFVTDPKKEKTITDPITGKSIQLVPLIEGANDILLQKVPNAGARKYLPGEFALYLGDNLYQPVKITGSITVMTAPIKAKIQNYLDFRHGTQDRTTLAPTVEFTFTDLSTQSNSFYIDFPKYTDASTSSKEIQSPLMPKDGTYTTTGSGLYWRVQPTVRVNSDGSATVSIPVQINHGSAGAVDDKTAFALNKEGYDQTMTIGLLSQYSGADYEKDQIKLRYRITDSVVKPWESTIDPVSTQKEVIIDGTMHYETTTKLELNSDILNGRNLYVWVEDDNGSVVSTTGKNRFSIKSATDGIQLANTFLGDIEGSISGSNNIYTITKTGEKVSEELDQTTIQLTLVSAQPGTFVLKMAVGATAQDAYQNKAGQQTSTPFIIIDKDKIPSIQVENVGDIYGKNDGDAVGTVYGKVKFTVKNLKLENGAQGKITIALDPRNSTGSALTVTFTDIHKTTAGYYEVFGEVKNPPAFDEAKLEVPIGTGTLAVGQPGNEATLSRTEWAGQVTFIKKAPVKISLKAGDGFQDGKLAADATGKFTITMKPTDGTPNTALDGKAIHLWLSNGEVMSGKYLEGSGLTQIADGANAGKYLLPVHLTNGQYTAELSLAGLPAGTYTVMAQVVDAATQQPVPSCASVGMPVEVSPTAADTWHLAVAVNGTNLTADNTGLFTAAKLSPEKAITVKATVTKGSTPVSGVIVKLDGDASQGGTVSAKELTTDANGAVTFTVTPKANTDYDYLYRLTATYDQKEQASGSVKLPVSTTVKPDEPSGDGSEGELSIIGLTTRVAVGDRASIYLEVYDKNDDLIKVTSDSMARNLIDRVYFDTTPSNSNNGNGDFSIQHLADGIEISFRPDYRGDYEVVIVGKNNTLRPNVYAVRQGEIVRMELEYVETNLGLGKTSSMPVITTYDREGVKAERTLLSSSRLDFYATGGAVYSSDDLGRVTVKDADRYIGTTITATVTDDRANLQAEYVFNVVQGSSSSSGGGGSTSGTQNQQVVLWDNLGAVGASNRFTFYLVGENGFRANLKSGQMSSSMGASATVSVASRPSGATVTADIYDNGRSLENGGNGLLYVTCNKEGEVKLNITLKVYNPEKSNNNNYYYKQYDYYRSTVSLQFKENASVNWGNSTNGGSSSSGGSSSNGSGSGVSVAMFVGSTRYTVNMVSKTMEAAPFVAGGRIYLPLRTLSDAIGAGIYYDSKTQKITIVYENEQIVMQVDSTTITTSKDGTYWVDSAPIVIDGRTYVPLRVVGDALRMRVTTVTDIYGNVVGAVLSK